MVMRGSGECQVNVKSQFELDIGGRETYVLIDIVPNLKTSLNYWFRF